MSDGQETLVATEARGRYLGVDPGLARTGYALISRTARGPVLLEGGVIETDRKAALHPVSYTHLTLPTIYSV